MLQQEVMCRKRREEKRHKVLHVKEDGLGVEFSSQDKLEFQYSDRNIDLRKETTDLCANMLLNTLTLCN